MEREREKEWGDGVGPWEETGQASTRWCCGERRGWDRTGVDAFALPV